MHSSCSLSCGTRRYSHFDQARLCYAIKEDYIAHVQNLLHVFNANIIITNDTYIHI